MELCPEIISDLRFRHIRFVNSEKKFCKVNKKFRELSDLLDYINKKRAQDAYYSTAKWLNPGKVTQEKKEGNYDTIFLGCDLFFDVDVKEKNICSVVKKAREDTKHVLEFINGNGWTINYIAFSGSKGFHVSVKDPVTYRSPEPKEREFEAKEFRKKIAQEVLEKKLNVDLVVLKDIRRITRIPYTHNSKSGYMCYPLQEKDLDLEVKEFLGRIPKIDYGGLSLLREMMTALRFTRKSWLEGFSSIPSADHYIGFAISSTVPGTGRHVLMLEIDPDSDTSGIIQYLKGRDILPIYSYKDHISQFVFSPVALDKGMILKILKKFGARNFNAFKKYSHNLLRVGRFYTPSFGKVAWKIECTELCCGISDKYPYSRAHMSLLNKNNAVRLCGGEEIIVRVVKIHP